MATELRSEASRDEPDPTPRTISVSPQTRSVLPQTLSLPLQDWSVWSEGETAGMRVVTDRAGRPALLGVSSRRGRRAVLYVDLPSADRYRSHDYVFEARVRCKKPGAVRLWVDDGVTVNHWADPNVGSRSTERLSIEGIVSHASDRLRLGIELVAGGRLVLEDAEIRVDWRPARSEPTLADLVEPIEDEALPRLDRKRIDETSLSEVQRRWREDGYVILPGIIPDTLIDGYCRVREQLDAPGGYPIVNPYIEVEEIKDLCLHDPLMAILEELIGEPMGMHLNLTGWVSTERAWHQDSYLNPPGVNNYYAAVWFALDDVSPDAGPFEYIPGSHRWFHLSGDRVLDFVPPEERTGMWPKTSESFLVPLLEEEIARRAEKPRQFLGRKGDVLVWNGFLMHRGAPPLDPTLLRKTIITHYSSIRRRKGPFVPVRVGKHGYYF